MDVRLGRPDGRETHTAFHGRFPLAVSVHQVTVTCGGYGNLQERSLDCSGLTELHTVGSRWLSGCINLTVLDYAGLTQLWSVPFGCPSAPI